MADNRGALTKTTIEKEKNTGAQTGGQSGTFGQMKSAFVKQGLKQTLGLLRPKKTTSVGVNLFFKGQYHSVDQ